MNQVEQQATSYLSSAYPLWTQRFSVRDEGILSLRRTGHGCGPSCMQENVKAEIHLAMKTICLFHNATLFFSPQRSQDGPVVTRLRVLRERNKVQGAGADDVDEDMVANNTKSPRRR